MTAPLPATFASLFDARDSSLPLAAAAIVQIAGPDGRAAFGPLAVTYREDFLRVRAQVRGTSLPESGSLSVDDARANLKSSVLPRLALEGLVTLPAEWHEDAMVAVDPAVWAGIAAEREATAAQLLDAAAKALERAETIGAASAATVSGGSRIESHGLVKAYKGRRVVDDVSVALQQGEIVGLLGPNGAGKTTTFYMFTGLVRPEQGTIHLDRQDITAEPMYRRARAGLGYLAQEPSVFRKLSVEDNVAAILETLPLTPPERAARLERLLDELGIKHLRRQKAYQLSGGERRRLEITRALVTEPKFLLLDEPFAGVDPIAVHDIQTIVAGLRQRGIGVLITDHNVEQTLDIVDRAYIMFEGRVQVAGSVRELVFDDRVADRYLGPTLTARLRARLGQAA
ncbi:MAG TPA: LPS export ABC transporter ATP-binding protein [Gemmatimonadales bacterium]|nr:LPS export ABC transporter ATP-binding protein [Gemmatimonadales bacterium]